MTIQEAYERISKIVSPTDYISIQVNCWWHSFSGKERKEMDTDFYVHADNHEMSSAKSLEDAVILFEAKNTGRSATTEEVEQAFEELANG